jgi:predicted dehydrogenase
MTEKQLRWGILGCGRIAAAYVKAIDASSNGRLVAMGSRSQAKADAFATTHGIPTAHGSYDALLADPDVDAVYIALPNSLHAPWSIRAAEAGKHVLCEKPMAASAAEGQAMADAFSARRLVLSEALMYRRHPLNLEAIRLLRAGAIGDLVSLHASFHAGITEDDEARTSAAFAGGALRDLGSYCVSIARWATQAEPETCCPCSVINAGGVDIRMTGALRFPGGVLATISCAFGCAFSCMYEFVGTHGRMLLDRGPLCAWPGGEFAIQLWSGDRHEVIAIPPENHYRIMCEEFADAVLQGKPLLVPVEDAIANLAVLDRLINARRHS